MVMGDKVLKVTNYLTSNIVALAELPKCRTMFLRHFGKSTKKLYDILAKSRFCQNFVENFS